jgi:tetratricopeptide (TPR) repeat protein
MNAKEYLSKAADLSAALDCKNSAIIGETYYSLASLSRGLRDLEKAGIYGLKAISLFENDPLSRSRSYNLIANVNEDKNEFEQSIKYNIMAISLLQEQKPLDNLQQQNLANTLQSLARVYMKIQMYDSAQQYYQQSLQIYNKLQDQDEMLLLYQNIGINYYLLSQNDSADYYLTKAVNLRKQVNGEKHLATSASLQGKGSYYQYLGQLDSALHYYQKAIVAAAGPDYNNYQPDTNPARESFAFDDEGSLLNALYLKGSVLRQIYLEDHDPGTLELALETLLLAVELMDVNQEHYQLEGSTLFMAEDNYSVFEDALDVCYTLFQLTNSRKFLETAFFVMEKSKARRLEQRRHRHSRRDRRRQPRGADARQRGRLTPAAPARAGGEA